MKQKIKKQIITMLLSILGASSLGNMLSEPTEKGLVRVGEETIDWNGIFNATSSFNLNT